MLFLSGIFGHKLLPMMTAIIIQNVEGGWHETTDLSRRIIKSVTRGTIYLRAPPIKDTHTRTRVSADVYGRSEIFKADKRGALTGPSCCSSGSRLFHRLIASAYRLLDWCGVEQEKPITNKSRSVHHHWLSVGRSAKVPHLASLIFSPPSSPAFFLLQSVE